MTFSKWFFLFVEKDFNLKINFNKKKIKGWMNLHFLILSIIFAIAYAQCPSGGTQLTNSSMNAVINSGQTYFITGDLTLNSISVSGTLYFKNVISIFKKYSKWTLKIFFPSEYRHKPISIWNGSEWILEENYTLEKDLAPSQIRYSYFKYINILITPLNHKKGHHHFARTSWWYWKRYGRWSFW